MAKKIAVLILALLLTLPFAVSCANNQAPETTTAAQTAIAGTDSDEGSAEATTESLLNIPDTVKFPDTKIRVLYWSDVERPEFEILEENGEKVNDALYKKNLRTEETLGIELEWIGEKGNYNAQGTFVNKAQAGANSTEPYDIHACYSLAAATLTTRGLTEKLSNYSDYLDFTKPWWPKTLIDAASINGSLYFCSGDISSNMLYFMYGCFFNKDMFEAFHNGEPLPYTYAIDGTWTIDKLIELSQGAYEDLDSDQTRSYGDQYGFITIDLHFDAFYAAAGLKTLERNADGVLIPSPDLSSDKTYDLLSKLTTFFTTSGDAYAKGTTSKDSSSAAFAEGRAVFTVDRVYLPTFGVMKSSSVKYGILPVPKYDTEQENYVTCMAFPYTIYSIASQSENKEAAAATLQVLGYNGYDLVTPALFYETMQLRYSDESNDSIMYDYIRNGVYIDIGRIFSTPLNNTTYSLWRDAVKRMDVTTWADALQSALKSLNSTLGRLNKDFSKLK
ncbi:MAG: hypothetical protein J6V01_06265 [Clostridia bacterium]|nr:hypothetical protein [Clostridia bacterium]